VGRNVTEERGTCPEEKGGGKFKKGGILGEGGKVVPGVRCQRTTEFKYGGGNKKRVSKKSRLSEKGL